MQITGEYDPISLDDTTQILIEEPHSKFKLKDPYSPKTKNAQIEEVALLTQNIFDNTPIPIPSCMPKTTSESQPLVLKEASEELFKCSELGNTAKVKELIKCFPEILQPPFNKNCEGESAFLYSLKKSQTSIAWILFHSLKSNPALLMDRGAKNRKDIPFTEAIKGLPPCPLDLTQKLRMQGLNKAIFDSIKKSPEHLFDSLSSIEFAPNPTIVIDQYLHTILQLTEAKFTGLSSTLKLLLLRLSVKDSIASALVLYRKFHPFISNKELWELLIELTKMGTYTCPMLKLVNETINFRKAGHNLGGEYFYLLLKADSVDSCISFIKLSTKPFALKEEIGAQFVGQNRNSRGDIDLNVWKKIFQSSEACKIIAPYLLDCLKPNPDLLLLADESGETVFHINSHSKVKLSSIIEI